jgi:hypothetical protein
MDLSAAFYDAGAKVSAVAAQAWDKVAEFGNATVEYAGHAWTWLATNIPAAWNAIIASATGAWAAAQPHFANFGAFVAAHQFEVAIIVGLSVIATLAGRAICNRLP